MGSKTRGPEEKALILFLLAFLSHTRKNGCYIWGREFNLDYKLPKGKNNFLTYNIPHRTTYIWKPLHEMMKMKFSKCTFLLLLNWETAEMLIIENG